ncbi:hypothetical protein EVA_06950 [gut metagenome]|uniref:Uncharacterized protein n=1 Tax=gut metagenome TaxID=749906 RepID=J9GR13_9ZZZZ
MKKKIVGISRSPRFSPNSVDRDEAIFATVVQLLREKGWEVDRVGEDEILDGRASAVRAQKPVLKSSIVLPAMDDCKAVLSMARDFSVLQGLAEKEKEGLVVLNSSRALLAGNRVDMARQFAAAGVPIPRTLGVYRLAAVAGKATMQWEAEAAPHPVFPLWLKRSGACAQSAADVCFVADEGALTAALSTYAERGIDEVLACEHLQGDLVKFYGVEGTAFFHCYYPTADNAFSKFGLEKINGAPSGYPLDVDALKHCADQAAALCGLTIYGGDAVVDAAGQFRIIDFNDWPSYSRCCAAAAAAIVERLLLAVEPQ